MNGAFAFVCPACGGRDFGEFQVLWPALADAWELSESEKQVINRQQGFHCHSCGNNLRSMALAAAVLREIGQSGPFSVACERGSPLRILEINRAGELTQFLARFPEHRIVEYPQANMMALPFGASEFDIVVHSDTLEHVASPVRGLAECRRILAPGGVCLFTVPIVVGRASRSRAGLPAAYHGQPEVADEALRVHTEFGDDAWRFVIAAGFASCEIFAFEFPAALVMIARA